MYVFSHWVNFSKMQVFNQAEIKKKGLFSYLKSVSFPSSITPPLQSGHNRNLHKLKKHIWNFYLNLNNSLSLWTNKLGLPFHCIAPGFLILLCRCPTGCFRCVFCLLGSIFLLSPFHRKGSQVLFTAFNMIASVLKPEHCNMMLSVSNVLSNRSRKYKGIGLCFLRHL